MARPCSVCCHIHRRAIDSRLVAGDPLASIAKLYVVSRQSLRRHRDDHLPRAISAAAAGETRSGEVMVPLNLGGDLINQIDALLKKNIQLQQQAEHDNDTRAALLASREMARILELQIRAAAAVNGAGGFGGGGSQAALVLLPSNRRGDEPLGSLAAGRARTVEDSGQ